jgi:hypothetical protein
MFIVTEVIILNLMGTRGSNLLGIPIKILLEFMKNVATIGFL